MSTKAGRDAAAPKKRWNGFALIVIGIVVGVILGVVGNSLGTTNTFGTPTVNAAVGLLVGLVLLLSGVILAMRDSDYNRKVLPDAFARWDRSWQCQRCGTVFVI